MTSTNIRFKNPLGLTPSEISANAFIYIMQRYQRMHMNYPRRRVLKHVAKFWCSLTLEQREVYKKKGYRMLLKQRKRRNSHRKKKL